MALKDAGCCDSRKSVQFCIVLVEIFVLVAEINGTLGADCAASRFHGAGQRARTAAEHADLGHLKNEIVKIIVPYDIN